MPVEISDLPFEVLEKILRYLNYEDLLNVRKTSKYLDGVGRSLQQSDLRRTRRQVTEAVRRFCSVVNWRRGQVYYLRRLAKGASSLLKLAAMIEIVDAETYHLVKAGVLPPLPGDVLAELKLAVKLASKRNPLVGRARLRRILQQLQNYWANTTAQRIALDDTVLLHTIVDVIDCLPRTDLAIQTTEYGIQATCRLLTCLLLLYPPLGVDSVIHDMEEISCTKSTYINLFRYLPTHAGKYVCNFLNSSRLNESLAINELTLEVACSPSLTISSLCQVKEVAARGFRLTANTQFGTAVLAMSYQGQHYFK